VFVKKETCLVRILLSRLCGFVAVKEGQTCGWKTSKHTQTFKNKQHMCHVKHDLSVNKL